MTHKYPSDIELYYSTEIFDDNIKLTGTEFKHAAKVMRHTAGDTLYITNGFGKYYVTTISAMEQNHLTAEITSVMEYENKFKNIYFCFPRLKSNDRFEFELEKSIELGITNFIVIDTERTIPKGEKIDRWNKIALAAMKQSLRMYLPKIEYAKSLKKINDLSGIKILLDQQGDTSLHKFLSSGIKGNDKPMYFVFGPEGGLTQAELNMLNNSIILSLTENRLRAETAVITTAVMLNIIGD